MTSSSFSFRWWIRNALSAGLILLSAGQVFAQAPGGGGGGRPGGGGGIGGSFGGVGGGGGGGGAGSAATTRNYTNSTMLGDAMISSDADSRNLIVVTDEKTFEVIKKVVADLDRPQPQVLIDCVFVQVTHTNELDLGTEMTYTGPVAIKTNPSGTATTAFGLGLANPTGAVISGLPDLGNGLITTAASVGSVPSSGSSSSNGAFYSLVGRDVNATIHALSAVNKTEVLSRPSVLTRNNQQATILVGAEIPIITSSTVNSLTGAPTNTVTQKPVGIILKVTPFITAEGDVQMILDPQISSLSAQTVPIGNGQSYPVINLITADTVVVTPNNQTVVLGGMMQTQNNETQNSVPLLGDIPIIGYAFKYKTTNRQKTELIIFLTPHIVRNPADLTGLSADERARMELTPKAFEKNELKRFDGTP